MNNIPLFILVLTVTISSCTGMLVLAGKFLQDDETQNDHKSRVRPGRLAGRGVQLYLPPPADQWRRNLVQRCTPRARMAREGRRLIIDRANRSLQYFC